MELLALHEYLEKNLQEQKQLEKQESEKKDEIEEERNNLKREGIKYE